MSPHSLPDAPLTRALKAWSFCLPVVPSPRVFSWSLSCVFPLPVTVSLTTSCPNPTPEEGTLGVGAELMQHLGLGNQE